jgi:hypothetical protein
MSEENATAAMVDKDRGIAFVVLAMAFNIVGLGSLALGNAPVAAGLLIGSLVFLSFSLFYLTKEDRQTRRTRSTRMTKP